MAKQFLPLTPLPKFISVPTINTGVKTPANILLSRPEPYLETPKYRSRNDYELYISSLLTKKASLRAN
jgi:hypothetical protein